MQSPDHWQYLLQQYLHNTATEAERRQLFQVLDRHDVDWESMLTQLGLQQESDPTYRESDWTAMINRIVQQEPVHRRTLFRAQRWWMAAAVLCLLTIGIWWLAGRTTRHAPVNPPMATVADIPPGKSGAVLTLADGRQLVLDSSGMGHIAREGNMIVRHNNGQLVYEKEQGGMPTDSLVTVRYNTLATPRGRQFQLVLPDGTRVWLNAASAITYPVVFNGSERHVQITGEAYFEVAHNSNKPFIVSKDNTTVQVLGTHFNMNAYDEERSLKVTLLEGKVKVTSAIDNRESAIGNQQSAILKPGEQAIAAMSPLTTGPADFRHPDKAGNSPLTINHSPDLDNVMAWKNGLFDFQDASLQQVMRQLARWYDVEIVYEKGIPDMEFGGKMGRDLTLSNVLHFLGKSGLHYRLENNRRLVVLP